MSRLMRRLMPIVLLALAACVGQEPPERSALPAVGDVLEPPRPCAVMVGQGSGVVVDEVVAGTGAEGVLQAGDVVTAVDGVVISSATGLREEVMGHAAGEVVTLGVIREGTEITADVMLGENPEDSTRPLVGILITTRYDEIPLSRLPETEGSDDRLARVAELDGEPVVIEPVTGSAFAAGLELPDGPWYVIDGVVYRLPPASPVAVGDDGSTVALERGTSAIGILGSVRGLLLVSGFDESAREALVVALDPATSDVMWSYRPGDGSVPVAASTTPDGEKVLVVLRSQDTEELHFAVVDAGSGAEPTDVAGLETLSGGTSFGWFDDRRLLAASDAGDLSLLDITTGESEPITLPIQVEAGIRLWPVGDGEHILVADGGRLLSLRTEASSEVRVLAARCSIGDVGAVGSGRW